MHVRVGWGGGGRTWRYLNLFKAKFLIITLGKDGNVFVQLSQPRYIFIFRVVLVSPTN